MLNVYCRWEATQDITDVLPISSCQLCNIHYKALLSSPCYEGWVWGRTWAGNLKGFGTRATSSGLYLKLGASECRKLWHPVPISFLWLMSPQASLGTPLPLRVLRDSTGPPCVESMCLRLIGRGLTVTWLTFTLTIIDRFRWYGYEAFVHYGRGLWDPWIQVVKGKRPGWLIYKQGSLKCLQINCFLKCTLVLKGWEKTQTCHEIKIVIMIDKNKKTIKFGIK